MFLLSAKFVKHYILVSRLPSIFLSYNPGNSAEETLAIRLHTLGAVHGFRMALPDRYLTEERISEGTKGRIKDCSYYILFSTQNKLSKVALEEIQYAYEQFHDKSKIIIIYDAAQGKNMNNTDRCTELFYDRGKFTSADVFVQHVLNSIRISETKLAAKKKKENDAVGNFVLAGLGLLLLGGLLSDDKK
jgi:hypothetical protein